MTSPGRLTLADLLAAHSTTADKVVVETPAPATPPVAPTFRRGTEAAASSEVSVFRPATEKQVAFLRKLVAERMPEHVDSEHTARVIAGGSARVSKAIEQLLAKPKVEAAPIVRANKFGGTCENCGTPVEAEAGVLTKADNGKWEVAHKPGECPVSEFPFPVGRYAVALDDAIHFFHAGHEGLFEQASDTLYPVQGARAKAVVALIALDPVTASHTYGTELEVCGRCGRTLTDETSRAMGIGPTCAKKEW